MMRTHTHETHTEDVVTGGWGRGARAVVALVAAAVAASLGTGCLDVTSSQTAICVLIDVSGTYADESDEVVRILKREVIPSLEPGDTLVTIVIDSESYVADNVVTLTTLDPRPSRANAEKLALSRELDAFAAKTVRSKYTDIPGAMMLGAEYLRETNSAHRVMLVFSDLREELPHGARRELRPDEFADIHVVAMNVKRLGADNADPERYRKRLEGWQARIEGAGGAGWQIVMDASKLTDVLGGLRS